MYARYILLQRAKTLCVHVKHHGAPSLEVKLDVQLICLTSRRSAPNLQITLPLQAHECLANTFKRSTHDGRLYVPHPAEFSTHTKVSKQGNQNVCVQQASNIHPEPPDPGSISSCKIEKALKNRKGKERTSSRCFQKLESSHKKYE